MTCQQARQQLAAYRRDDWTATEMRALADHLAGCAACRQVEASYRSVGESLRLLPTITPDVAFRERVLAAIAADQRRLGPAAIRASRAETEPSLPVVRAPVTPISRRRAPVVATRAALAIAAALVVALLATQFVPSFAASGVAASFFRGLTAANATPTLTSGVFAPTGHLPFTSAEFHSTTMYRGWVGSRWVYVYAGEDLTSAVTQQGRGALRIYDSHQTLVGVFPSPQATRSLTISGVHGATLTLTSDTGATLSFNMASDSFSV